MFFFSLAWKSVSLEGFYNTMSTLVNEYELEQSDNAIVPTDKSKNESNALVWLHMIQSRLMKKTSPVTEYQFRGTFFICKSRKLLNPERLFKHINSAISCGVCIVIYMNKFKSITNFGLDSPVILIRLISMISMLFLLQFIVN